MGRYDTVTTECTRFFKLSGTTMFCSKADVMYFLNRCGIKNYCLTPILTKSYELTTMWLIGLLPPDHHIVSKNFNVDSMSNNRSSLKIEYTAKSVGIKKQK